MINEPRKFQKTAYTSDFWRQKMRTMHGIFDVNNDGVISFEDFVILADKFGDLGHLSEKEMVDFRDVMKVQISIYCLISELISKFNFSRLGNQIGAK